MYEIEDHIKQTEDLTLFCSRETIFNIEKRELNIGKVRKREREGGKKKELSRKNIEMWMI